MYVSVLEVEAVLLLFVVCVYTVYQVNIYYTDPVDWWHRTKFFETRHFFKKMIPWYE